MRGRILVALLLALTLMLLAAAPAAAESEDHKGPLLALGDSVAFGYNPLLSFANANNFVGYPEIVARRLELKDVNSSCPGETTGSFISSTAADNGCRDYRVAYPLHVGYSTTQLAFAISYLRTHHHVSLVTIDIGANDVFVLQKQCNMVPTCINAGLPTVLATIKANLEFIFDQIRNAADYRGRLVSLTYYSLSYDQPSAAATEALNQPIIEATRAFHGILASGFDAFKTAALAAGGSSCAAGLLIVLPTGGCDVHPTPKGRDLLAQAILSSLHRGGAQDQG
jgi:lysophospholipase L1-like esterase